MKKWNYISARGTNLCNLIVGSNECGNDALLHVMIEFGPEGGKATFLCSSHKYDLPYVQWHRVTSDCDMPNPIWYPDRCETE